MNAGNLQLLFANVGAVIVKVALLQYTVIVFTTYLPMYLCSRLVYSHTTLMLSTYTA